MIEATTICLLVDQWLAQHSKDEAGGICVVSESFEMTRADHSGLGIYK